ncbi:MAG: glycosyltransferase family 4 protein [Candidatus Levybacteria bacterium]|nr:glycosyltransferase family 4 protein [Candidatus Levybacteria bacterium]
MRVLFLSRLFYPHIGGVEKHVVEVSRRLIKLGHEVTVVTEILPQQFKIQNSKIEGITVLRVNAGRDGYFKKFRIWREIFKNRKLIQDADVVHAHDVFFWYLPFRFLYPSKKIFTTFHGYEGDKIPGFKAKLMHKIAEKLSHGNICVGEFLKKWYGTKPNYVTYGAVKIPKFKLQITNKFQIQNSRPRQDFGGQAKQKILFLGRLEEETGIMEYLKALRLLKEKNYKFEVTVLGDGSLFKKAEKFSKKHKIKAFFKGFVPNIDPYLKKSDFIFTSRYLGILEALSFQKLIFAAYNNEIKKDYLQMAPFAKYISISPNYRILYDQINYYLRHEKKRNQMIDQGFEWVKNETWKKMAEAYLKLWKKN